MRDTLGRPYWLASADNGTCYYQAWFNDGLPGSQSRCDGSSTWVSRDGIGRLNGLGHYYGQSGAGDATWLFDFNPASQIRSVTRDNDAYAWTGHYADNRGYTTNGLNQYVTAGSAALGYDANGNLTSEPAPGGGLRTYSYDVENRLVASSAGASLAYDPLGRLYQVTDAGGTITRFLYDGEALVAEYDAAGEMTRRYVHWDGADVPLISYTGASLANPTYLHADHQGSVVAISGASGATQINRYDEYGIPGAGNAGRFQYTGQVWLAELGLYYYKARMYSPGLGRFLQTDAIGYQGGINLYAYVGDDPVNHTDPSGTQMLPANPFASEEVRDLRARINESLTIGLWHGLKAGYWTIATMASFAIGPEEEAAPVAIAVIGRYPAYVNMAERLGARFFQVPERIYESWTPAQRWAANRLFLDRQIARGAIFRLATPASEAPPGSAFAREIAYLRSRGYELSRDGRTMRMVHRICTGGRICPQ